jgi:DNA replication and repair protein RecF
MFSRGQQKLFYLALCMVQARMAEQSNQDRSILLLDDISSELDQKHQRNVLHEIALLPVQTFVTATELTVEKNQNIKLFHVERGRIR